MRINNRPSGFLAADHDGGIWVGSLDGTLLYYRAGQAHTISLPAQDGSFTLMDMAVDYDDSLLLSTSNGLFRWDSQQWNVLNNRNAFPGDAERNDPGLLLFDMDEIELFVVENDLNHGSFFVRSASVDPPFPAS